MSEEQKIIDLENEISFLKNALYEKQKEILELKERNENLTEAIEEWINGERINDIKHISKDKIRELMNKYNYLGDSDFEIELIKLLED